MLRHVASSPGGALAHYEDQQLLQHCSIDSFNQSQVAIKAAKAPFQIKLRIHKSLFQERHKPLLTRSLLFEHPAHLLLGDAARISKVTQKGVSEHAIRLIK